MFTRPTFASACMAWLWICPTSFAAPDTASNYDESRITSYTLPDLFTLADGGKVTTSAQWENQRKPELLEIFSREVYGIAPPKPEALAFRVEESDPAAMEGKATRKQVAISLPLGGETFTFHLTLLVPNQRTAPAPVFMLLNHRPVENTDPTRKIRKDFWPAEEVIARGYAIASIHVAAEVEPDRNDATTGIRAFYQKHSAKPDELSWGALAAWAWAGSRAMDYFQTDADVNAAQVAVVGHSRTGKAALWAAAKDTRLALACVNGAGEGGPALSRRNFGETISQVTTSFPYWFTPKYATYAGKENTLPIDQHQLIALVAPRGYHGGDGKADSWADPRGSWLALVEASKVWAMFGKATAWQDNMPKPNELLMDGPLAYHVRDGGHDLTGLDWKLYLDHADRLFTRTTRRN
ncbi:acetylxylan esterase [bacterium]|nr:acetylxylan esterase [bacterium]